MNELSGFNKLVEYYNKNKDKPWDNWLTVKTIFPKPGKQGLVGIMESEDGKQFVFKISQYVNYLVHHELTVMKSLNSISDYCPHFCRAIGSIMCSVDPKKKKEGNPFIIDSTYSVEKEVMLTEYLNSSYKLYNYIISPKISEDILFSTVKQVLLAISIAQRKRQFTHYDLHSNNIMMKKCSKDLVFLYVLDENNQFCVATRGHYPVIIDYGFSYSNGLQGEPLWPSLNHTDVGFLSDRFDPIADPKLFLITVSDEINEYKKSKKSKKLLNITKNNYNSLNLDWDSGWDAEIPKCASDSVISKLSKTNKDSTLFTQYEYYCMDILQTLIVLPLEKQDYSNIATCNSAFLKEFIKIENVIGDPFYGLYILKGIVDSARTVRADYIHKETRQKAVDFFRISIFERIDSISKFCRPEDIHFEKMLCGLLCLGKCIEGILYKAMNKRWNKKLKEYRKLPLQTPEELCAIIELNIEDTYIFNENTTIMVIDCINNKTSELSLSPAQINSINQYETISRGSELYKVYQQVYQQVYQ